jgi:hypothetical protein
MNPTIRAIVAVLPAVLVALGASAAPEGRPSARLLLELRGEATAQSTLDRLGLPSLLETRPEELPFRDFFLSRNLSAFVAGPFPGHPATIRTLAPDERDALPALYASGNWSRGPDTPEGFQSFVPPSAAFTNFVSAVGGKWVSSEDPNALRDAIEAISTLPATLPAEGDLAIRFSGADFATTASPGNAERIRRNLGTFTAGLGLDGHDAVFHALLEPVPGSGLADTLGACGPVPAAAACVNLPGSFAFHVQGPGSPVVRDKDAAHGFAVSFFPPSRPERVPRGRLLFFYADPARETQLRDRRKTADTFAVVSTAYRGIPVDTVPAASADILMQAIARSLGIPEQSAALFPRPVLRFAWLPGGHLLAVNDDDSYLLHAAIDAALDGTAIPFWDSSSFPVSGDPVPLLAHLDLGVIAPLLSVTLPFEIPSSCPVDLLARMTPGGTLDVRLRAPVDFVRGLASSMKVGLSPTAEGGTAFEFGFPVLTVKAPPSEETAPPPPGE